MYTYKIFCRACSDVSAYLHLIHILVYVCWCVCVYVCVLVCVCVLL